MIQTYPRHSPSSLNMFAMSPALFVLERILNLKQVVGAPAHRGTGVEAGVAVGLKDPKASDEECIDAAYIAYDTASALSPDSRKEAYRESLPGMVRAALEELRPYGVPTATQGLIEQTIDGLSLPIVGYFDFMWEKDGLIIDLKTSGTMPSAIKAAHARQVAFYTTDNQVGLLTYCTPKKCCTYQLERAREHRQALVRLARKVEQFLSLSDDPNYFTGITAPDLDSYLWSAPHMRELAYQYWRI